MDKTMSTKNKKQVRKTKSNINHLIKLLRKGKPTHCELWNKEGPCSNKIEFYCFESGGFLCAKCANIMHKKYPKHFHIDIADKYLKEWYE